MTSYLSSVLANNNQFSEQYFSFFFLKFAIGEWSTNMFVFFCLKRKKKKKEKKKILPTTYVPPFLGMGETFRNSNIKSKIKKTCKIVTLVDYKNGSYFLNITRSIEKVESSQSTAISWYPIQNRESSFERWSFFCPTMPAVCDFVRSKKIQSLATKNFKIVWVFSTNAYIFFKKII